MTQSRASSPTWIVEGPWHDVPGTDERECDRVELTGYPITTAFEAWRAACLPGNPPFGACRITREDA